MKPIPLAPTAEKKITLHDRTLIRKLVLNDSKTTVAAGEQFGAILHCLLGANAMRGGRLSSARPQVCRVGNRADARGSGGAVS
jgi:hypothetical protein